MKVNAICPVSDKKINERVARINATFTVLILLTFVITKSVLPVLFLVADFLLRAGEYSKFSLVGISSKGIVKYFAFEKVFINAGPKLFAARIGFFLSSIIAITFFLGFYFLAYSIAWVLVLFSFLEAAFGICVACEIYPYTYKFFYKSK